MESKGEDDIWRWFAIVVSKVEWVINNVDNMLICTNECGLMINEVGDPRGLQFKS